MKINIVVSDKQYAQALGLTLARCLSAIVSVDGEGDADFVLCDRLPENANLTGTSRLPEDAAVPCYIAVSKFEPVTCVIDRIRAVALRDSTEKLPNVKTVAVTGVGGSGVSTVALLLARLFGRLQGKRVLLLSFSALGGPSEAFVYEALAKGRVDLNLLAEDEFGVIGGTAAGIEGGDGIDLKKAISLNPLRRLTRNEIRTLLSLLGSSDSYDLIVLDVPLASSHWELSMRVAETAVLVGNGEGADVVQEIYEKETKGLGHLVRFENLRQDGKPDLYSETGAALRRLMGEVISFE